MINPRLLVFAAGFSLAACGHVLPPKPQVIPVIQKVYVPVDPKLTERCPWVADGAIEDVFPVASGRKRCLLRYENQLQAIEKLQGSPVPEGP